MGRKDNYTQNYRCANCGGIRSDQSALWCIRCVAKHGNSDHAHVSQCFSKSSKWKLDTDGCMVREHGDIDITKPEVCIG